ncbi:Angiotensin-converting enzyme [Aphelenchoides besseyi]|nr:Angiotensin-converting enzyme [Aphelenchoides besseyi]
MSWQRLLSALLLVIAVRAQIDSPSVPFNGQQNQTIPIGIEEPSIANSSTIETSTADSELINLDQFTITEEDEETVESSKPDDVDNDIIQELVDQFLNKGTLDQTQSKKTNTEAQALINSSSYWDTHDLEAALSIRDGKAASKWLAGYSEEAQKVLRQVAVAAWKYFTSASPITKQALNEAEDVARLFLKSSAKQAQQFDPSSLEDPIERKQLSVISKEGLNALDAKSLSRYNDLLANINRIYTSVDVYTDLINTIQTNTDATHALSIWKAWRSAVGQNLTEIYEKLVAVTNKAAKLNGYEDAGEMWRSAFDVTDSGSTQKTYDIAKATEDIYTRILPLYTQLHAYFRRQIAATYNSDPNLSRDGPIPAYLLRSSTGDDWSAAYEETKPFDQMDKIPEEITDNLHKQTMKAKSMFAQVFRYMRYLGFEQLPESFWKYSVFSRIWSKDMICNPATAYDMLNGTDFRVKICAQIGQSDFVEAHKLFAQLYYKYLSNDQPFVLRDAPSSAISSAVADAFGILATNVNYLKSQRLISPDSTFDQASLINSLYQEALSSIVKIPFSLIADKWRYAVFEEKINSSSWSDEWWNLREKYQGVGAPKDVPEAQYDAVAAAEISQQHAPATRQIVEYVAQFQVLKALCEHSKSPLSESCIPTKEAMMRLMEVMKKGGTISWLDALEKITGLRQLDAGPLVEYFTPLSNWLSATNEQDGVFLGWDGDKEKFKEQVPRPRSDNVADRPSIPSDDQIAYPGGSCTHGQECLLDTMCNGTVCVCNPGLFTLQIGDTYNCVPGDPANAGFRDGSGLVIAITPNNQTLNGTLAEETAIAEEESLGKTNPAFKTNSGSTRVIAIPLLMLFALSVFMLTS